VKHKIVEKSGSWFSCDGERLGQGRESAKRTLKEDSDLAGKIEQKVKVELGIIKPLQEVESANS